MDTTVRMTGIAKRIVEKINKARDRDSMILYNREWRNATHQFIEDKMWFNPTTDITVNQRQDVFSQRYIATSFPIWIYGADIRI